MTSVSSSAIRQAFLDFFASKGHTVVASSPLVPDDPTLLFTNAGMVQFKDTFLGLEKRTYSRATTAQKCLRVSGKHNDLENVGPSVRHHTFFEMLGNFSFGDYFKREAIAYAWEFVTEVLGLAPDRIWPTIYKDDDQAFRLWQDVAGVPSERITRRGKKDNFWMMGDTGPCGPCSEIVYDRGPDKCTCHRPDCHLINDDCERWWEAWNLVFMEFNAQPDGSLIPLPKPSVDTGMGFERLVAIMQRVDANYDTDLFLPILDRIQELAGHTHQDRQEYLIAYRVIADHARAMTFLIADGVLPGNEGRPYVLRMIMRRAMRFGKRMGLDGPFLGQVSQAVTDIMGDHYRELIDRRDFIQEVIAQEEERFRRTLDVGLNMMDRLMADLAARHERVIPGRDAFRLYDTYGFPLDLTRDVAREQGMEVDEAGFHAAMAGQRERARAAQKFGLGQREELYRRLNLPATRFVGYQQLDIITETLTLAVDGQPVQRAEAGAEVEVVLAATPFYSEAGGQVGDTGVLEGPSGRIIVEDTQSPLPGLHVHLGRVVEGRVAVGDSVRAAVDAERRLDIMRNHTATHLLHKALREVLGEHALQRGSLVAPDRLRFDFSHLSPVTPEELAEIEAHINDRIRQDLPVTPSHTRFEQAIALGAMALFGEKYSDIVRMITIGGDGDAYSRELCGGTHLSRTGQIGFCLITAESSVGAGLRRIEAVTGRGAEAYVRQRLSFLERAASALQTAPEAMESRLADLLGEVQSQRREIARLRRELARRQVDDLLGRVSHVDGIPVLAAQVDAADMEGLREMTDWLRDRLSSGVIVLGAVMGGRPGFVAAVTPDLVERGLHAGRIVQGVAQVVGGGGGGRPSLAQAGGSDADKIGQALHRVLDLVRGNQQGR